MNKVSRLSRGNAWALGLTTAAVIGLFIPHFAQILDVTTRESSGIGMSGSLTPLEALEQTKTSVDVNELLSQLEDADVQWQPQQEVLPDGSIRYRYKRRSGEPDLSVKELRALMDSPPTFDTERQAILSLLQSLRQAGVKVLITPTMKKGAAAEWDHRQAVLRIQPHMTGKGSLDFLRVLNHEAIHVAQSCRGGYLRARPRALGLPVANSQAMLKTLRDPVYNNSTDWEKALEMEAYGYQNQIHKAAALVRSECKNPGRKL